MVSTSLMDFTPTDVDMLFAVSQQDLNQGLAEYMNTTKTAMNWAYDVDDGGNFKTPADATKPNISFSGTLGLPPKPASGAPATPTWIVDLSQAGAANQVTFNVTFADATFIDNTLGKTTIQSGSAPWIIPFQVDLKIGTFLGNSIPQWLQDKLAALNGSYGNVFDLSQVLLDMETLASSPITSPKTTRPNDVILYEWDNIVQGVSQQFKDHASDIFPTNPSAGYAITHNGEPPTQPLPTYTPTAVDFVIIPSAANNGGASTLVFVLMTSGKALPKAPANAFTDVSFIDDPNTTPGIALISSTLTVSFVQKDFQAVGIDQAISQYVQTIKSGDDVTWQLTASDNAPTAALLQPAAGNSQAFLSWTMPPNTSSVDNKIVWSGADTWGSATTNSSATATFSDLVSGTGYGSVTVGGTVSMSASYNMTPPSVGMSTVIPTTWTSPAFDWNWSAYYAIQSVNASDNQSGGGVQFVLDDTKSSYPAAPVSAGGGSGGWFSKKPSDQDFISNILAPVFTKLPTTFETNFKTLASLGSFVFSGGGTFTFQDPAVNNSSALYTVIQYQNPN